MFMLRQAAEMGWSRAVKYLIQRGTHINNTDSYHETPLLKAVKGGHFKCAKALLAAGADANIPDIAGDSPLHIAAGLNNELMLSLLLDNGASPVEANRNGRTALHAAAFSGAVDCIELLITRGAEIDAKDRYSLTPLLLATLKQESQAAVKLIRLQADINVKTKEGLTALQLAAKKGDIIAFKELLEHGANPTVLIDMLRFIFNKNDVQAKRMLDDSMAIWQKRQAITALKQQPQAQLKSQNVSKPRLLFATMPTSGKSVVFEQKYMPSTGDCAFAAFANNLSLGEINRVRADVSETLLGLKQDPESRKFLADEIAELYIAKQFDSRNTAGEGASLFSPKTEVSDHAKLMATTFTTSTKLNDEIARAAFLKNCRTESLYSHYVQSLSDRNWLGLKSAQLYAKEKGIELYIWRKLNNSSQLSLEVHQAQLSPNRVLHLLYTGGFSHFDRLEPRPEPVNTLQESKEQPLMTASAFRTANIRARALAKSSERKESAHIA